MSEKLSEAGRYTGEGPLVEHVNYLYPPERPVVRMSADFYITITTLLRFRNAARKANDNAKADEIRIALSFLGVTIIDRGDEVMWYLTNSTGHEWEWGLLGFPADVG